jgi:hypothetical protein
MNSRGLLLSVVGLAAIGGSIAVACQRDVRPGAGRPVTIPAVPASAPAAPERELSVVWLDEGGAEPRSFFLDWHAGTLSVRAERAGAWFVHEGGVYRFEKTSARRSSSDCSNFYEPKEEPAEDAEPAPESLDLEAIGAVAKRLDRPGDVELVGLPDLEGASTYGNSVSLAASAGKHLFIETSSDEYYCGAAHGFRTHAINTFDLEHREYRPLLEAKRLAAFRRDEVLRRRPAFLACTAAYAKQLGPEINPEAMLDDVTLAAILPRFTPKDGFHLELGWAMPVAYAFGSEEWGSYTSGCPATQTTVTLPFDLEAPPRALSELMTRRPKATAGGWSRLTNTSDAAIGSVDAAFKAPEDP